MLKIKDKVIIKVGLFANNIGTIISIDPLICGRPDTIVYKIETYYDGYKLIINYKENEIEFVDQIQT